MKTFKERLKGTNNFQEYYEKNSNKGKEEYLKQKKEFRKSEKLTLDYNKEKEIERKEKFNNSKLGKTYIGSKLENPKKVNFKRVNQPIPKPAPMFSREQQFIRTFFGHGDHVIFNSGTDDSLPHMQGHLNPRRFNEEDDGTAQSFGFGSIKTRSGLF
jgi:hypothetical protein